jgi:CheY-like chemotaxis protein
MVSILIIDDEPDVRDSVAKVLDRAGYEVVTAESAESGLGILDTRTVDVIITDIIMPGTDGVQAIRKIRETHPHVKILAISGGGNFGIEDYKPDAITTTAYLQAATEAGADAFLTKPFQRQGLTDAVSNLLTDA